MISMPVSRGFMEREDGLATGGWSIWATAMVVMQKRPYQPTNPHLDELLQLPVVFCSLFEPVESLQNLYLREVDGIENRSPALDRNVLCEPIELSK